MSFSQSGVVYSFGPGVVWQWMLRSVNSPCSQSVLIGHDVRLTPSLTVKPRCVPGYATTPAYVVPPVSSPRRTGRDPMQLGVTPCNWA